MNTLTFVLLGWISLQTSYAIPPLSDFPAVLYRTEEELARIGGKSYLPGEVRAAYDPEINVFYVVDGFDPVRDLEDRAVFMHENVHFMQVMNRADFSSCPLQSEYEAHLLEWRWRKEHGMPPQISPIMIAAYSIMCLDDLTD